MEIKSDFTLNKSSDAKFVMGIPFYRRVARSVFFALLLLSLSLGVGMWGYHHFEHMPWIDAFVNASMILSGMGPLGELHTTEGKLFAGFYALYSGVAFLVIIAVVLTPILHRAIHKLHLDNTKK